MFNLMGSRISTMSTTYGLAALWKLCASFWTPKSRKFIVSAFDNLSDEEIVSRLKTFDFESDGVNLVVSSYEHRVFHFTPDTVVKYSGFIEASREPYMMDMVLSQTSIPLPKVRRTLDWDNHIYIFMEYIEGNDLGTVWPSLTLWGKLRVAWTLRGYVRQLRKIKLPRPDVPGPMDASGKPLTCIGHYFTEYGAGPFASYAEMTAWYSSKRRVMIALERSIADRYNQPYTPRDLSFDNSMPLVFTHGDISLNNVRVGKDGTIWLIDWGYAGAYPPFFEYSSIMAYDDERGTPVSWLRLAPVIAGRHYSGYEFLKSLYSVLKVYFALQE